MKEGEAVGRPALKRLGMETVRHARTPSCLGESGAGGANGQLMARCGSTGPELAEQNRAEQSRAEHSAVRRRKVCVCRLGRENAGLPGRGGC